jgi:hypothetical protein
LIETGGGRFDPAEDFVFFIAGMNIRNAASYHPWTLMGVDAVMSESGTEELRERIGVPGAKLMLDSGVFWLATQHAQAHGLDFYEALTVKPTDLKNYDKLLTRYVEVVREFEDDLWGYVEVDQGGADVKRSTRHELEAQGLHPIPVYHPLTDGFEYLDELLDGYDRIAVGNVVMSDAATRRALLGLVWERRRRHSGRVWIHALGYTPNPLFLAYPFNSSDSSSHLYALRYGASMCMGRASLAQFGTLEDAGYSYDLQAYGDEERGLPKKTALLAWIARSEVEAWRRQWADLTRVLPDLAPWPNPYAGERDPVGADVHLGERDAGGLRGDVWSPA